MKSTNVLTIFVALAWSLVANPALAQVLSPASLTPLELVPQIANSPVMPSVAPNQTNLMAAATRRAPGQNVKDLVKDFRTARQEFLDSQQELLQQLKLATEEQRAIIREQLKENLNDFRELQKTQIQELRDQTKEIINNVPITDVINTRDLLK